MLVFQVNERQASIDGERPTAPRSRAGCAGTSQQQGTQQRAGSNQQQHPPGGAKLPGGALRLERTKRIEVITEKRSALANVKPDHYALEVQTLSEVCRQQPFEYRTVHVLLEESLAAVLCDLAETKTRSSSSRAITATRIAGGLLLEHNPNYTCPELKSFALHFVQVTIAM